MQSNGTLAGTPGPWVKHFTYDGLGRLIRTQSPWPWPDTAPAAAQSERYYYDGYRRIQKVLIDPIALDNDKQPIKISKEVDLTRVNISYNATVDREYVWDPVDTDRILCQYYASSNPYYITTDQTWTPTAQLDSAGHITDQFTYDPYGTLLTYDDGGLNAPGVEMGHQGLFFDRLDVGLLNTDGSENPRLAANAAGIYYNRARTYSPSLGRFLQADPNGTGMAISGLGMMGAAPRGLVGKPRLQSMYGDGPNVFGYVRSSPMEVQDPTGLDGTYGEALAAAGIQAGLSTSDKIGIGAAIVALLGAADLSYNDGRIIAGISDAFLDAMYALEDGIESGLTQLGESGAFPDGNTAYNPMGDPGLYNNNSPRPPKKDNDNKGSQPREIKKDGRPPIETNPKHHQNSSSPEPSDAGRVYQKSVSPDGGKTWYGMSESGENVYRYSGNPTHWNGRTGDGRGIPVPNDVWKALGGKGAPPR